MRRAALPLALLISVAVAAAGSGFASQAGTREEPTINKGRPASVRDTVPGVERFRTEAAPEMKIIQISGNQTGNKRYPGVCENQAGDRLVIFRGPNSYYWYSFCRKGGSWTNSVAIPNDIKLDDHAHVDVVADSSGRFHCVWEEPDVCVMYASFLNGVWTAPKKLPLPGKHDMGVSIAVRSNDEIIIANADVIRAPGLTKDIFFFFKRPGEDDFRKMNMINDAPSSTQPSLAVDAQDHIWMGYKSEPKVGSDELVIRMRHYRPNNDTAEEKTVTDPEGWHFWPQAAINSDGMLMLGWAHTQNQSYEWRLYNTKTRTWSEVHEAGPGIPLRPWATFWSKMVAHGEDFYWAVMDPARVLRLLKYDAKAKAWDDLGVVSRGGVEYHDMYAGYDTLLIAWSEYQEPSNVFLTTIGIAPAGPTALRISGKVLEGSKGLSGVILSGLPGNPATDSTGYYSANVEVGWTGTVVPKKTNYNFLPPNREYFDPIDASKLDEDYAATKQFMLTISAGEGGTTNPPPAVYYRDPDTVMTVRAVPNADFRFIEWTGDPVTNKTANPTSVTFDKNKSIRANFFRIRSVINLRVEKRVERSFFRGYELNALTWEANPENAGKNIPIAYHRVYRKGRTEADAAWTRIAEVSGTVFKYDDPNLPKDSDFVYAVTCVDDLGNESSVY